MIGHRGGFFQRTAIFKYAVMPVARTLSPATRESQQPDAREYRVWHDFMINPHPKSLSGHRERQRLLHQ